MLYYLHVITLRGLVQFCVWLCCGHASATNVRLDWLNSPGAQTRSKLSLIWTYQQIAMDLLYIFVLYLYRDKYRLTCPTKGNTQMLSGFSGCMPFDLPLLECPQLHLRAWWCFAICGASILPPTLRLAQIFHELLADFGLKFCLKFAKNKVACTTAFGMCSNLVFSNFLPFQQGLKDSN